MSDPKESAHLLRMARKDVRAARALLDPALADVETFGFHAQQATEKTLKAWLALRGILYPRIVDISAEASREKNIRKELAAFGAFQSKRKALEEYARFAS